MTLCHLSSNRNENLNLDGKMAESIGQSTILNRSNVLRSHACGSLFAKCSCSSMKSKDYYYHNRRQRNKLFQSYSHPDTTHVFTPDTNKNLTKHPNKTPIKERSNATKRLSTPNIGNYSVLDVAVHPEVVLTVSHANGQIEPRYADHHTTTNGINRTKSKSVIKNIKLQSMRQGLTKSLEQIERKSNLIKSNLANESCSSSNSSSSSQEEDLHTSSDSVSSLKEGVYCDDNKKFYDQNQTDNLIYFKYNALSYQQESINNNDQNQHTALSKSTKKSKSLDVPATLSGSAILATSLPPISTVRHTKKDTVDIRHSIGDQPTINLHQHPIYRSRSSDHNLLILEEELLKLKDVIKDRDIEVLKLKREIHKLKSVLQQTTKNIPENNNIQLMSDNVPNENMTIKQLNDEQQLHTIPNVAMAKKQGVSGESSDATGQQACDILIRKYDKDYSSKQLIKAAIMDNDFLKKLDSSQVREVIDSMYCRTISSDQYVIREGDAGAHLYVSAEGNFEVIKDGNSLGTMGPGKAFGELAILYNCTRTASIKVLCDSKVWVLDRRVFQQIMMRSGMQRIEENVNFLKSVPLLKNLSNSLLARIADVLEMEFFSAGTYVIRQGASGDTFYLISQGTVKVTQKIPGCQLNENEIRILGRGDYFGEKALIKEDKRTANIIAMAPGVECLTLDRESFKQLIGDLCELHKRDYGDETRVLSMKKSTSNGTIFESNTKQELQHINFKDLDVIATLGVGGFGRVELVKYEKDNSIQIYALKRLKKHNIVETHQQEHVFSERSIMLACNSPFICRLYRTYRDEKFVYMLLEACMGGEVWTILRNRGYFDDYTCQFIIGCVLEAFEYLHARGIVYRDLKPENLMLDVRGYIKLVDFGFSKCIGYSSKTWTFCGTPEYVAPEIILNKGHDRAVDYWALGVLIYELLTGTPPFTSTDPMKTYNFILKGIDMIDFPKHVSRSAIILIKRLCRDLPCDRLGYQRGGIQLIKKHKWFQGFDWDGLASLTLNGPFRPRLNGPLDTSNFDYFPKEDDNTIVELSGWDREF